MTEHLLVAQLTALADKTVGGPQDGHAIGTLSYTTACYQRCTKFLRGSTLTSDVGIARKEFVAQVSEMQSVLMGCKRVASIRVQRVATNRAER